MSILSGFFKTKRYRKTTDGYKLESNWTSGNTVELDDGNTVQNNLGAIKGITTSTSVAEEGYAADATTIAALNTTVGELNKSLGSINSNLVEVRTDVSQNSADIQTIASAQIPESTVSNAVTNYVNSHSGEFATKTDVSELKSDISGVNSDFQCRKTIIKNAFITSDGVISDADTYDMVCFEVTPETTIQSVQMLSDSAIVYGWFTSQPAKTSVTYDNTRTIVSGSSLNNLAVPSGCHWVAFRVGSNNDAEITPRVMSWELLQKKTRYATPEQFGAVGDGTTDDTTAFTKALATGLPVIATGNYSIGFLQLSGAIYGFGKGYIKCENILILPNAVLDGLTIENKYAEGKIIQVNTTNNASNGVYYNASVTNCTLICAEDSTAIYFYLYNGKGAMNVFFKDIIVKSTSNGFSVINLHTNQSEPSRPWMASIVFENIVCIESPFQYFIHCDKPVGAGASSNLPFYKAFFSGCQFQYVDNVTQYCAYIRGFKNTLFNIITYDFPSNHAIYWLDENEQSISISELPLSHSNLYSAIKGTTGYIGNIASIENRYYHKTQIANREGVFDSYTDNGSYFAYAMPVLYPVGFSDSETNHKINGVAIPQSTAVGNTAEGSIIFGYDNTLGEPIFQVYTNGAWKKCKILTEEI